MHGKLEKWKIYLFNFANISVPFNFKQPISLVKQLIYNKQLLFMLKKLLELENEGVEKKTYFLQTCLQTLDPVLFLL